MGDGTRTFQFDPSIHRKTKRLCKEEIISSFEASKRVIIVDNANLAKWEYGEYIVKYAKVHRYKVIIAEIQSESEIYSRDDHISHMNANQDISDCLLCKFQNHRCKMRVNGNVFTKFIQKYEADSNATIVQPKLDKNAKWKSEEIEKLIAMEKQIDYTQYDDDEWEQQQMQNRKKRKWKNQKANRFVNNLDDMEQAKNRRFNQKYHR